MRTINRRKPRRITRQWLERWADRLATKADAQGPYWFIHNASGEEGTFCFKCGEKKRKQLIKAHQGNPETLDLLARLDGGWSMENDGCEHCDTCGQLLHYSLTDHGAENEWKHFRDHGIDLDSPEVAYHVQAIIQHGLKLVGLSKIRLRGRIPILNEKQ